MTWLSMVGITHSSTSSLFLERVAVRSEDRPDLLAALRAVGCSEAVLLSTCSRVEIYLGNSSFWPNDLLELILDVLAEHSGTTHDALREAVEVRTGLAVVEHLFQVTAGLESPVLGEAEILGQTQSAFRESAAAGMTGSVLGRLFPAALRSGREVRSETSLGQHPRSLGHHGVDAGLAWLGDRADPAVLVVGSGQMAVAAVAHLVRLGIWPAVAAKDVESAVRLAGPGGVCPMSGLTQGIAAADLLICTTSAAEPVVTVGHVSRAMSGRTRPLTVVDLSLPRNVDSAVGYVPEVTLIDLEDLDDAATTETGLATALATGMTMASAAAGLFFDALAARDAGPVIAALRLRVEQVCYDELARAQNLHALEPEKLTRSAQAIAGKLLHRPTVAAREAAEAGDADVLGRLCDVFGIPLTEIGPPDPGRK